MLTVRSDDRLVSRLRGALLWTHFGISGPVALNASRHWHRAAMEGRQVTVRVSICPDDTFDTLDRWFLDAASAHRRSRVATVVAMKVPAAVADVWTDSVGIARDTSMAHLDRDARRRLVHALIDAPLTVRDSRGYNYAEVTAGGVPLDEVDPSTMESRRCGGLYLVGEMLDVDGRLGGFNFQWAWSSGWVAGSAIAHSRARAREAR
jgi:predicted Rossmann fold flavoprotein